MISKEFPNWNAKKVEAKIGIRERHVASDEETALDLAVKAGRKALKNYNTDDIDFIILCTQSPDYILPTSACILQSKLGLKNTTGAFDYNLGCSGFIYGLAMSKALINTNMAKSVLLIMSDTYTKHINKFDFANRSIFGDGATAIIVESCSELNIQSN